MALALQFFPASTYAVGWGEPHSFADDRIESGAAEAPPGTHQIHELDGVKSVTIEPYFIIGWIASALRAL